MTGGVLLPAAISFAAMVTVGFWYYLSHEHGAFGFEDFWDKFCAYGHGLAASQVLIAMGVLVASSFARFCLLACILKCLTRRQRKWRWSVGGPSKTPGQQREYAAWIGGLLEKTRIKDPRYRKWADRLGMFNVVVFAAASVAILVFYGQYSWRLDGSTGFDSFSHGWSLGKMLSDSSLVPSVMCFGHAMYKVRGRSREAEDRRLREIRQMEDARRWNSSHQRLSSQHRMSSQQHLVGPQRRSG
ncbi:hypothetical protein F5X68DRAFT_219167 [Plectosphaerella plurivora]|uniref:Uncharacterized protein n=1 Tax=Plectosphaerella plurivora TaxID=936078 RepID=A0A9P8UVF3_9PEZI|nr:hypothetical protein F5X68DRAFT_219167 [Plectosphaerella plurivora]